jgi:hypothetical protein
LARWANSQRKLYFLRFGIFSNNLDIIKDTTIAGLESLFGWSWSCNEEIRLHEHIEPNIIFLCHMYNQRMGENIPHLITTILIEHCSNGQTILNVCTKRISWTSTLYTK